MSILNSLAPDTGLTQNKTLNSIVGIWVGTVGFIGGIALINILMTHIHPKWSIGGNRRLKSFIKWIKFLWDSLEPLIRNALQNKPNATTALNKLYWIDQALDWFQAMSDSNELKAALSS